MTNTTGEINLPASEPPASQHPQGANRQDRLHEGLTMALYISLSLLAVLVALPRDLSPSEAARPALVVLLTALGLILAHAIAYRLSSRLMHGGLFSTANREILLAQFSGGLTVTLIAVAPVLIIGGATGVTIAEFLLLGFIAAVGYAVARSTDLSRTRALLYVGSVVVVVLAVIGVKNLVGH